MCPVLPLPHFGSDAELKKEYGERTTVMRFSPIKVQTNGKLAENPYHPEVRPLANKEFTAVGVGIIPDQKDQKCFVLIEGREGVHLLGLCVLVKQDQERINQLVNANLRAAT